MYASLNPLQRGLRRQFLQPFSPRSGKLLQHFANFKLQIRIVWILPLQVPDFTQRFRYVPRSHQRTGIVERRRMHHEDYQHKQHYGVVQYFWNPR